MHQTKYNPFKHLLFSFSPAERKVIPPIFSYLLNVITYSIWIARNNFIFSNVPISTNKVKSDIRSRLALYLNIHFKSINSDRRRSKFPLEWGARGHVAVLEYDKVVIKI